MGGEFEKVRKIMSDHFGNDIERIKPDSEIINDLKLDDLDMIELTMVLEETYKMIIPDDDVERWRTVGDVARYIAEN